MNHESRTELGQTASYLLASRQIYHQALHVAQSGLNPEEAARLHALADYYTKRFKLSTLLDEICKESYHE